MRKFNIGVFAALFLIVNFSFSQSKNTQTQLKEIVFKTQSDYSDKDVKWLNIKLEDKTLLIRYINDDTYIALVSNNKKVINWQRIIINATYDSSYDDAEKRIKIFYNPKTKASYLITPSYTEELTRLHVYSFSMNGIKSLGEYYIPLTERTVSINTSGHSFKVIDVDSNLKISYIKNKSVVLFEKDSTLTIDMSDVIPLKQLIDSEKFQ